MRKLVLLTVRKKTMLVAALLCVTLAIILLYFGPQLIGPTLGERPDPASLVNKKIFIDPGHGGEDPGCNDPRQGIYEKDINLMVGQITREILKKTEAEIILSRENDRDYVLPKDQRGKQTKKLSDLNIRLKMAEDSNADVFLSLHVNSTKKKTYAGAEAFYNPANPASVLLAQSIQNHLRSIPNMTKRIAKPGDYYILNNTSMPSVIIEMGYLSNSKEKELLVKKSYQEELALAISRGLVDYFKNPALEAETPAALQDFVAVTPKVAIIIDDLGNSYNKGAEEIFQLSKYPLTLAIMPNMDSTETHALRAEMSGFEILVHMPMESESGKSSWLGPGTIKSAMSREAIINNLNKALAQIPNAVGMNNHMGSLITKNKEKMLPIMEVLRDHEMFFIDSGTNDESVCREVAKEIGVPCAKRTLFLDNRYDYASIREEILKLAELSRTNGSAIGIGHVGPQGLNTVKALIDTLPLLEEQGIELVFVSELMTE